MYLSFSLPHLIYEVPQLDFSFFLFTALHACKFAAACIEDTNDSKEVGSIKKKQKPIALEIETRRYTQKEEEKSVHIFVEDCTQVGKRLERLAET